jgi:hypothetical protein
VSRPGPKRFGDDNTRYLAVESNGRLGGDRPALGQPGDAVHIDCHLPGVRRTYRVVPVDQRLTTVTADGLMGCMGWARRGRGDRHRRVMVESSEVLSGTDGDAAPDSHDSVPVRHDSGCERNPAPSGHRWSFPTLLERT